MRLRTIKRVVNESDSRKRRIVIHLTCGHKGSIKLKELGDLGPLLLMGYIRSWPCPVCEDLPREELVREVLTELADALQVAVLLAERCDDVDLQRTIFGAARTLQRLWPRSAVPSRRSRKAEPPSPARLPQLTESRS